VLLMQMLGVFLSCLRRLGQVIGFLKGQIWLCQQASLYAHIPDTANESITKHVIERFTEIAMLGEFS